MTQPLHLHEEILLLALHDEKGKLTAAMAPYAMAGALLIELLLAERISIAEDKRALVEVESTDPVGDPLLDEALERIASHKRRERLTNWVTRLAQLKRFHHRVAEGLCERGILEKEEGRVLFLFPTMRYPEREPGPEKEIVERIRRVLDSAEPEDDPRTVALIVLTYQASVLHAVFPRGWLKEKKPRVELLTEQSAVGAATQQAVLYASMVAMQSVYASLVATNTAATTH